MLHQNIMCWWNVFQRSTSLREQLLTSVVHRPTDACSVIYRSIAARQLSDSSAECEYKDAFITCGKLLHVSQADFLNCRAKDDVVSSCKGMEDSECFLPCLYLKL